MARTGCEGLHLLVPEDSMLLPLIIFSSPNWKSKKDQIPIKKRESSTYTNMTFLLRYYNNVINVSVSYIVVARSDRPQSCKKDIVLHKNASFGTECGGKPDDISPRLRRSATETRQRCNPTRMAIDR